LKEENAQLPQGYLKSLEPLQGYINKLSNGERGMEKGELHQTYNLISGVGADWWKN
jgi:hypothetical protein